MPGDQPWFFTGNTLYEGYGPRQVAHELTMDTTLGALRDEWGDPAIGEGLPDNTPACSWGGEDEDRLSLVVVELG